MTVRSAPQLPAVEWPPAKPLYQVLRQNNPVQTVIRQNARMANVMPPARQIAPSPAPWQDASMAEANLLIVQKSNTSRTA